MTVFAQIVSFISFAFMVFFLISIVDFMKKKTRNDEKLIQMLERVLERLTEKKE